MNSLEIRAVKLRQVIRRYCPDRKEHFVSAIVTAAGNGERMGGLSKPFFLLRGKECVSYSLAALQRCPQINEIILTAKPCDHERLSSLCRQNGFTKVSRIVAGGATRQDSVKAGFFAISDRADVVLIHDAARPMLTADAVKSLIEACLRHGAVCAARKVTDTTKRLLPDGKHLETVDRESLYTVQTPQVFLCDLYRVALALAEKDGASVTDDAALCERAGFGVELCEVLPINLKLTRPEDAPVLEKLLSPEEKDG